MIAAYRPSSPHRHDDLEDDVVQYDTFHAAGGRIPSADKAPARHVADGTAYGDQAGSKLGPILRIRTLPDDRTERTRALQFERMFKHVTDTRKKAAQ